MIWLPFIIDSIGAINSKSSREAIDFKQAIEAIRCHFLEDGFAVWVQELHGKPVAFGVMIVSISPLDEKECFIWLVRALPGACMLVAEREVEKWAKERGCLKMTASNSCFSRAKEHWLKRKGYQKAYDVWERRI